MCYLKYKPRNSAKWFGGKKIVTCSKGNQANYP
jgi:hypothetical protein